MNCKIIQRSELADMRHPGDGWQIIEANGVHPHEYEDRPTETCVIDNAAIEAIVNAGVPTEGLLVDRDHLSHDDGKTTEAMAWVRELAACPSATEPSKYDLAAREELTDIGREALKNKRYKFHSTEYNSSSGYSEKLGEHRWRPLRLIGLAYTNRPNNPGQRPISNRGDNTPGNNKKNTQNTKNTMNEEQLKQLAMRLGLEETATFDDCIAAIDKIYETVQNSEEEAAKELVENADSEGVLTDEEKEAAVEKIVQNREKGHKLLNAMLNRKGNATIKNANRSGLGRPRSVLNKGKSGDKSKAIYNRAMEIKRAGNKNWVSCWNEAKKELA